MPRQSTQSTVATIGVDIGKNGGTLTEQMTVLWGAYLAHSIRAEHTAALEVAQQCLALAAHHEPVYSWFVEGFDTTSLKEAKALLGELTAPP